ncbi:MAG: DUF1822 family protein [Cyanobacteriota bacterium]|nr:DUF1822 family protein [Cyanobacteriota bacterium]
MTFTLSQPLTVALGRDAHRYAELFAAEQATPLKGKRVYFNTLAVYAVHTYLKWLSIKTALQRSDCWHPGFRAMFDVADLVLPDAGKLECRPILPGEDALVLPPEVRDSRMGYVAVGFGEQLDRAELLGFVSARALGETSEEIALSQLESLDGLIDEFHWHRKSVGLRQWFEGVFQQDWQPVELLLTSNLRRLEVRQGEPEAARTSVTRGKFIDWALDGGEQAVILVVKAIEISLEEVEVRLRLYPFGEGNKLPPGLVVTVLDEEGTACMEAETRNNEDWLQLEFSCQRSEIFQVRMTWQNKSIAEQFFV